MEFAYQDQKTRKQSYASIESTILVTPNDAKHSFKRNVSWASDVLGSDKLVKFHEKQRAFRARQRPNNIQVLLGSIVLLLCTFFGTRALLASDMFQTDSASTLTVDSPLIDMMKDLPSSQSIRDMFLHYTSNAHLAGTRADYELAKWTRDQFQQFGLKNASIETYYPYMNYPVTRQLSITSGPEDLQFVADLKEPEESTPTFHAYSADGNVTGSVVYVNFGRLEDFVLLVENKIELKGSVALMRHGHIPSGIKIQHAETFGCIGALVYTDDDTENPNVVHRASVEYDFIYPGDPLTPGYAASFNATRNATDIYNMPSIPSLPISWSDALPLLRATQGFGIKEVSWAGHHGAEIEYFSGPSVSLCNLVSLNEYKVKPIWNVLAHIEGHEEPEKAIIIGNHRDAWDHGAADPSSGSAVLLELARVFSILLENGWKPRRSIILASWDANEYGNVGSTEWVEDNLHWLDKDAVAYLNVDHAVTGPHFSAQSSPLLQRLLIEITSMVIDPRTSNSVFISWLEHHNGSALIPPVGTTAKLDSVAFFEHAGIPSLSMSFDGDEYRVRHSTFDSIAWMEEFGDPTFEYHQTMVRIWGLLVVRLSGDIILPFYPTDYALAMKHSLEALTADDTLIISQTHSDTNKTTTDLPKLASAIQALFKTSTKFDSKLKDLEHRINNDVDLFKKNKKHHGKKNKLPKQITKVNERLLQFERNFVRNGGLLIGRPWYKHAIYGPSAKSGLLQAFPSIIESMELQDSQKVDETEELLALVLKNAQRMLSKGERYKHDKNLVDLFEEDVSF